MVSDKAKTVHAFFSGGMGGIFNPGHPDKRTGFRRLELNPANGLLTHDVTN